MCSGCRALRQVFKLSGWQQLVWRGTGLSSSPQEIWYEISAEHLSKGTPPEELASATYVLQGNRIIPFLIVEKIRGGLALKAALQLRLRGIQWCLSQLCFLVLLVRRNVSDTWHNWHLGHGRYFLSSAMVVVSTLWPGTSVPERFAGMTVSWRAYCRRRKVKPVLSKITKETCGYISFLDWPEGGWQKGSTTTLLSDSWTATMCLLVFVYALSFFLSILLRNGLSMCSRCPSLLSRCWWTGALSSPC